MNSTIKTIQPPTPPERRRHPRVAINTTIEQMAYGGSFPVRLKDISLSGARLDDPLVPVFMDPELALRIRLPGLPDAIDTIGHVVRDSSQMPAKDVGIRFVHLDDSARRDLADYINAKKAHVAGNR